jgi:CheY-like chemotaxis protein
MRTAFVALIVAAWLATPSVLGACGDKFLLVGRGPTFGRAYASLFPGSIVLYSPRADQPQEKLAVHLQRAGHRVAIVTTESAFAQTLRAGQTDIVIADMSMKSGLDTRIETAALRPTMLYVITESNKQRVAQLRREVPEALKASDKVNSFLVHIEETMKARTKAGVRVKRG